MDPVVSRCSTTGYRLTSLRDEAMEGAGKLAVNKMLMSELAQANIGKAG
jgi:hypothetical protein